MALTPPLDLLPAFPGWTTGFSLAWRQEQSRQASGRILVKDMGSPLWTLRALTRQLAPNELDYWRARFTALENGEQQFWAFPKSRCYPIAYPNGSWPTGSAFAGVASLATINTNRKAVSLSGLPSGFVLSVGDFISITVATGSTPRSDLHQVMEGATASVGGATGEFEVRPHIWPDVVVAKPVNLVRPACLMAMVPDSLSSDAALNGWGSLTFQAIEARL